MLLNGKWTCQISDGKEHDYTLDGNVPGCVHTDLIKAGIIGDIFWRTNADDVQWIENCDVTYSRHFSVEKIEKNAVLIFDGLDVYCDIYLNGKKIGSADDMFYGIELPVDDVLNEGDNFLEVKFFSPIKAVEGKPKREGAFTTERLYTRRIQCTYGWDWVARFVTMGIFRDVRLEFICNDYLNDLYVYTDNINPYSAQVGVKTGFLNVSNGAYVDLKILSPEGECIYKKSRRILSDELCELIDIKNPKLWYPSGYGEQPLYTIIAECGGRKITTKFGIRTVRILEIEDEPQSPEALKAAEIKKYDHLIEWDKNEGSSCFIVLINDLKIFCKGGNWVPCEPFPSDEDDDKIDMCVRMAKYAGVNMLRVWGGGILEKPAFYEACDKYGIMVTQDFFMACGNYPEEDDYFIEQLKKESRHTALKIRNHPSLVWWSGDNENAVNGDENQEYYMGRRAALEGIEPVLKVYDPKRRFLPSSPYGGFPYASAVRGTSHNSQYLSYFFEYIRTGDLTDYRRYFERYITRFTVEQPILGLPYISSLLKFMTEEDIYAEDYYVMEYHCKNNPAFDGTTLYEYALKMGEGIFGKYTDQKDVIEKMQRLQCEWLRISLEMYRRNQWFSSGIIYWMFNDCWPASNSWSIVDYYNMPKPAYYTFKRCAAPVLASVTKENGNYAVYVSNNGLKSSKGKGRLYIYDIVSGEEKVVEEFNIQSDANETYVAAKVPETALDGKLSERMVILCDITTDLGDDRAFWLPFNWDKMPWEKGEPILEKVTDEEIIVTADVTIPNVLVDVPYMLEENGYFLKKGEKKTVKVLKDRNFGF